jgi:hypothetical protein
MPELATIRIFEHARGRRYSAHIEATRPANRTILGERHEDLRQAVLNVLAKYDKARRYQRGDRGRPPGARDVPGELERQDIGPKA